MGRSKKKQEEHSKGHNKRNGDNTSQIRAANHPEFNRETVKEKSSRKENRVEEEPSDNDRDHQEKKQTNRNVLEEGGNDEYSSRIDEAPTARPGNNEEGGQVNNTTILKPLTETEKDQIFQLTNQDALEEGIAYALRHMIKK